MPLGLILLQERVWKSAEKSTTNRSAENGAGFGMNRGGLKAPVDLLKEGGAESGFLMIVVLRSLVQFVFGKSVELRPFHSFQLGPGVPEHVVGRAARARRRVPGGVAAVSFLHPEALILLV